MSQIVSDIASLFQSAARSLLAGCDASLFQALNARIVRVVNSMMLVGHVGGGCVQRIMPCGPCLPSMPIDLPILSIYLSTLPIHLSIYFLSTYTCDLSSYYLPTALALRDSFVRPLSLSLSCSSLYLFPGPWILRASSAQCDSGVAARQCLFLLTQSCRSGVDFSHEWLTVSQS